MNCHSATSCAATREGAVALLGNPNVGKSVLFQRLTGRYATVSNYPGTTVEIARGLSSTLDGVTVLDTPGLLTLPAYGDEEKIAAQILLEEPVRAVVHVGDAKNLRRTLLMTVQLAEMGLPMVLALNMMDEAEAHGVRLDPDVLAERLGLPVVPTIATSGQGIERLQCAIGEARSAKSPLTYPAALESELDSLVDVLPPASISPRGLGLLWLCGDPVAEDWLRTRLDGPRMLRLVAGRRGAAAALRGLPADVVQSVRSAFVDRLMAQASAEDYVSSQGVVASLTRLTIHPLWGWPILAAVLGGLYAFVGIFGAQTLVGWIEGRLFGETINPWLASWVARLVPIEWVVDLIVGEYGLWTMGMTYALALILPIISTFFLAFSLLEDSGYLPRLAVLSHRLFRAMGLNGKAVLPMILGLGCVTMATLTTRILETRRERMLAILLLALAVPCSAQLGVVMGMLGAVSFGATLIWVGMMLGVLVCIGWLAAKLVPGERSTLLIELPPLRRPVASNVVVKTAARLEWYLKEVVPLFLLGSILVFVLDRVGVLDVASRWAEPVVTGWLGLPPEATLAFLMGFLRRDFGATGLFALQSQDLLTPLQTVVAMVTITLFIPCVAAVLMIARERGWRMTLAMTAFIFPFAFAVGGGLRMLLHAAGWT
jgi:ferrous iron transport protein B